MEMIDVVFEQIRKDSHSKKVVETMTERIKHILACAMPDDYEEIDLPGDQLIDVITMIRRGAKKPKCIDGNYQILKEMLIWQKRFYLQGDGFDTNQMLKYNRYIKHHEVIYKAICEEWSKLDKFEFIHRIDWSLPLAVSVKGIDEFCDSLKIVVKSLYKMIIHEFTEECKGLGPFLLFHAEVFGNNDLGNEKLTHWFACYEAYIRCQVREEKKVDIVKDLHASPLKSLYSFNLEGDMSNASAKLTTFIDEAKSLIASAERGTFPY